MIPMAVDSQTRQTRLLFIFYSEWRVSRLLYAAAALRFFALFLIWLKCILQLQSLPMVHYIPITYTSFFPIII